MASYEDYRATAYHPETDRPLASITYHTLATRPVVLDRADHWGQAVRRLHKLSADPRIVVTRLPGAGTHPVSIDVL